MSVQHDRWHQCFLCWGHMTSRQRYDVASTLLRYCMGIIFPLGWVRRIVWENVRWTKMLKFKAFCVVKRYGGIKGTWNFLSPTHVVALRAQCARSSWRWAHGSLRVYVVAIACLCAYFTCSRGSFTCPSGSHCERTCYLYVRTWYSSCAHVITTACTHDRFRCGRGRHCVRTWYLFVSTWFPLRAHVKLSLAHAILPRAYVKLPRALVMAPTSSRKARCAHMMTIAGSPKATTCARDDYPVRT